METISHSSATGLTEDLIIEILIHLPLISILRFRCVCKSWYKLLDHKFLHTKHKNVKLLVGKQDLINQEYIVELKSVIPNEDAVKVMNPFNGGINILGSCNGLVYAFYGCYIIYVWNPCTAEYKEISGVRERDRYVISISYGFGYDSKTCDYKLVTIYRPYLDWDDENSNVEIHTLGSDPWTRRFCCCISYALFSGQPGVFLNGALHWLAKKSLSRKQVILSFDMEEESSKKLPLPAEHMNDYDYIFVDVLRGCLCLLCSVSNAKFEIWEMKDYGVRESWSKLLKIDMQQIMTMGIQSCHYIRRAVSLGNGEILLEIIDEGKPYSRHWRADVVRLHLEEKKVHEYMKNISQMVPYVESFVSVNSGTFVGIDEQTDS